jgi:hypothetical protein
VQALAVEMLRTDTPFAAQLLTGAVTLPFPVQAQLGLQQSLIQKKCILKLDVNPLPDYLIEYTYQYLVVVPVPLLPIK